MKKIISVIGILVLFYSWVLVGCATPPQLPDDEAKQLEREIQTILSKKSGHLPENWSRRVEVDFIWPLKGPLLGAASESGINIRAFEGQEVRAVKSGVVTFVSERLRGYGKTVVITHPDGFVSMYAYNSEIVVKIGEEVKQGQVIARASKTGRAQEPQLHFRLTKDDKPVNPINYLPK